MTVTAPARPGYDRTDEFVPVLGSDGDERPPGFAATSGRMTDGLDRRTGALLVKLPAGRVHQLIDAGHGAPFAPAGRTFREWAAITVPDRHRWQDLLAEARTYAERSQPPIRRASLP